MAERHAPVQLGPQHLGVDEKADQATGFRTCAVGHRHTDTQILLAAVAVQQHLKTGQQEHKRRHPALPGQAQQAFGQLGWQREIQSRTLLAWLHRA